MLMIALEALNKRIKI